MNPENIIQKILRNFNQLVESKQHEAKIGRPINGLLRSRLRCVKPAKRLTVHSGQTGLASMREVVNIYMT